MEDHPNSKIKGLIWILLFVLLAGAFGVGTPWFARRLPWSFEAKLDQLAQIEDQLHPCESGASPKAKAALKKLIQRLVPLELDDSKVPLEVSVTRAHEVNAFASFNGKIFLNQGLLDQAQSAEEVAGVFAHEFEHLKRRHLIQNLSTQLITVAAIHLVIGNTPDTRSELYRAVLSTQFTKSNEEEADQGGVARLMRAEVDPKPLAHFFERLAKESSIPAILSDHPDGGKRAQQALNAQVEHPRPVLNPDEWQALKHYCGS